jgi:hypothetical protein
MACGAPRLSEEEREVFESGYADGAMKHLRRAVAGGVNAAELRNDPELAPLHGRADFRVMVGGAKDGH